MTLEQLIAEREPALDQMTREREQPTPPPYRDPFYVALEHVTVSGIQAALDHSNCRRKRR